MENSKALKNSEERLALLKSRLSIAKSFAKKPHEAWKKWIGEYEIDDIEDTAEIRDRVRIGYVFRKTESELPAIFDDQPELFIKGRRGSVKDIEPLIDGTYDYLWDLQDLEEKIEDVGIYFSLIGMGFIESPWIIKTKKVKQMEQETLSNPETGETVTRDVEKEYLVPVADNPMAEVANPFKLYFSPETKFSAIMNAENCPGYFREMTMTVDEVEAKFGKRVDSTETLKTEDNVTDTTLGNEVDKQKDDLSRVTVYKYYGTLPREKAPEDNDWTYDKEYEIFFTNNEELKCQDNPYDAYPIFIVGNYGLANKFWKFGDAKHLMPLIQELERYRSQILKHTRKMVNPKPLIPTMANIDEDAFNDPREGRSVKYEGTTPPTYLSPAALGNEVGVGIEQARQDLEKTSGQFDLASGTDQSTVKTPRGIQVYSEAADKSVRRKRKKISRLIKHLIAFQFQQISKFWKPEDEHVINVVAPDVTEPVKVTSEVLETLGGVNQLYNIDIEIESLSLNRVQMRQDALDLLDLALQHPEVFNVTETAKDALQNGYGKKDADRFLLPQEEMLKQMIAKNPQLAQQILMQVQAQTQPTQPNVQNPQIPIEQSNLNG